MQLSSLIQIVCLILQHNHVKYATRPTTGVMKDTPKVVTPTAASTIGTPNPFAALAETPESEPESVAESVPESVAESVGDIPDDKYLPNQVAEEAITEGNPEATTTTTTAISIAAIC